MQGGRTRGERARRVQPVQRSLLALHDQLQRGEFLLRRLDLIRLGLHRGVEQENADDPHTKHDGQRRREDCIAPSASVTPAAGRHRAKAGPLTGGPREGPERYGGGHVTPNCCVCRDWSDDLTLVSVFGPRHAERIRRQRG